MDQEECRYILYNLRKKMQKLQCSLFTKIISVQINKNLFSIFCKICSFKFVILHFFFFFLILHFYWNFVYFISILILIFLAVDASVYSTRPSPIEHTGVVYNTNDTDTIILRVCNLWPKDFLSKDSPQWTIDRRTICQNY